MSKIKQRIIGIDYGLKRIGLAFSDEKQIIAFPWMTAAAKKKIDQTVLEIVKLIQEHGKKMGYEVAEIVVGMPLMMNGKVGYLADETVFFIEKLRTRVAAKVISWDERLSSVQANRTLESLSRKKKSALVDQTAAVIILQSYLDKLDKNVG